MNIANYKNKLPNSYYSAIIFISLCIFTFSLFDIYFFAENYITGISRYIDKKIILSRILVHISLAMVGIRSLYKLVFNENNFNNNKSTLGSRNFNKFTYSLLILLTSLFLILNILLFLSLAGKFL